MFHSDQGCHYTSRQYDNYYGALKYSRVLVAEETVGIMRRWGVYLEV
jgi:hypothetical protein